MGTKVLNVLSEEIRCASGERSYFTDRSPADVNVMQDIVTRVHLESATLH